MRIYSVQGINSVSHRAITPTPWTDLRPEVYEVMANVSGQKDELEIVEPSG